jgi:hypothetical protein
LTWQGKTGLSGVAIADYSTFDPEGEALLVTDQGKTFCSRGLLARDQGSTYAAFEQLDGYTGDLFVITSEPTPLEGADCDQFEEVDLVYQVTEVVGEDTLRISTDNFGIKSPLPTVECFGQAFSYEIRAFRHWILRGSKSGYLYHGITDPLGQCVPGSREALGRTDRVFAGRPFVNYYFTFTLERGSAPLPDDVTMKFTTQGGFEPLGVVLGNAITDIELSPDLDLLLVDQASDSLFTFDLINSFEVVGKPVS